MRRGGGGGGEGQPTTSKKPKPKPTNSERRHRQYRQHYLSTRFDGIYQLRCRLQLPPRINVENGPTRPRAGDMPCIPPSTSGAIPLLTPTYDSTAPTICLFALENACYLVACSARARCYRRHPSWGPGLRVHAEHDHVPDTCVACNKKPRQCIRMLSWRDFRRYTSPCTNLRFPYSRSRAFQTSKLFCRHQHVDDSDLH